jgi:hypothetical protein
VLPISILNLGIEVQNSPATKANKYERKCKEGKTSPILSNTIKYFKRETTGLTGAFGIELWRTKYSTKKRMHGKLGIRNISF